MSSDIVLGPGANAPITGDRIVLALTVPQLGGATLVLELPAGGRRTLTTGDAFASPFAPDGQGSLASAIDLANVPADVASLRLVVWSPGPNLPLARAVARVGQGSGAADVTVGLDGDATELRAAELLEVYRRGDTWKVRGVAAGWAGHVSAMAEALGLPASEFPNRAQPPVPAPEPSTAPAEPGPPPPAAAASGAPHVGPSPPIGPPALRELLDAVIGPGARFGDNSFVDFELHGMLLRLTYEESGGFARVIAVSPGGEGELTDTVALAALRATGEAPLASVAFSEDAGTAAAFVSAPAVAHVDAVDSALLKALLAEVWVTAVRFNTRMRTVRRWQRPAQLTEQLPRELRLGIAEALQSEDAWTDVHARLLDAGGLPLVDEPAAVLMASRVGQLTVGPARLSGTARAWAIVVERIVRASVNPSPGLWRALALQNDERSFIRFGVQQEGLPGDPPAIQVGYSALQLHRAPVLEDLQRGLELVDRAANSIDEMLMALAADSSDYRNNLPWPATRIWTGPGAEVKDELLIREIAGLPAGAPPPDGLLGRARAQAAALKRTGLGYLAHLALLRAEVDDPSGAAWREVSRELVALAPVEHAPDDPPCATASLHVRMRRLDAPRPMRPPPRPPSSRETGPSRRLFG